MQGNGKGENVENSSNLHRLIRNTGKAAKKPDGVSWSVRAEHNREQASWSNSQVRLQSVPAREAMQVDTNSPSKVEEITKAAVPDGLSPSFFKDGDKTIMSQLTKLLEVNWVRGRIPKTWYE